MIVTRVKNTSPTTHKTTAPNNDQFFLRSRRRRTCGKIRVSSLYIISENTSFHGLVDEKI
jgi:hypothetical protein